MRFFVLLGMVLAFMSGPAFAQKVFIDYDQDFIKSGRQLETFTWKSTPETSLEKSDPLMHSRIVNAIEHYIGATGVREVDSDPDAYVTYHTSSKENVSVNTSNFGYGYPGGWAYGGYYGGYGGMGMGTSSTTVSTYLTGTLVVDVWDAESKSLIWRGTATNITVVDKPEKMAHRIEKALQKMVSKWQKMKAKM